MMQLVCYPLTITPTNGNQISESQPITIPTITHNSSNHSLLQLSQANNHAHPVARFQSPICPRVCIARVYIPFVYVLYLGYNWELSVCLSMSYGQLFYVQTELKSKRKPEKPNPTTCLIFICPTAGSPHKFVYNTFVCRFV